jgi:sugar (pentulose or hexulose) kinase
MTDTSVLVGIDIGTTAIKAAAYTVDGLLAFEERVQTPWIIAAHGEAEIDVDELADVCIDLVASVIRSCPRSVEPLGIGITGMAETGVVVDVHGRPRHRGMAWYDQRGAEELRQLPNRIKESFSAVTGLALKAECSLSKLLWLQRQGFKIAPGDVWLNAQEYVAYRLTGTQATERSLASRTALIDQDSGTPWVDVLETLGASSTFVPPYQSAGEASGYVTDSGPAILRGVPVTVAGHDHLVAAVGAGATGPNEMFNSCGTADVLVRSVPWILNEHSRSNLVTGGLSAGMHVLPGRTAILGATRFGLVLERVLTALGAVDVAARERLTNTWEADRVRNHSVVVSEPPDWTNEVTVSLKDTSSREEVVDAAIEYGLTSMRPLVELMDEVVGTFDHSIAGGGWAQLPGVLRAKATLLSGLVLNPVMQPGIRGAAAFAGVSTGRKEDPLTRELSAQLTPSMPRENIQ